MLDEMNSLIKNQIWKIIPRPKDKSIVSCKWIYSVTEGSEEKQPLRFKARLVVRVLHRNRR